MRTAIVNKNGALSPFKMQFILFRSAALWTSSGLCSFTAFCVCPTFRPIAWAPPVCHFYASPSAEISITICANLIINLIFLSWLAWTDWVRVLDSQLCYNPVTIPILSQLRSYLQFVNFCRLIKRILLVYQAPLVITAHWDYRRCSVSACNRRIRIGTLPVGLLQISQMSGKTQKLVQRIA